MRVSVIVPAYNAAGTIEQALRSIVAQSFESWEAIVADDASSDGTAGIAAAVDERVKVVRADQNAGPAAARNLALSHASGDLIALLDADDLWLPDYLTEMVGAYDREEARAPGVGIVCCDAFVEGPAGRAPRTYRERIGAPDTVNVATLLQANVIFVSALAPRESVMSVGGFDERTFGSEDHDLWLKLVERGLRVITVPQPLAVYRVDPHSVSGNLAGMARTVQATHRLALARGNLSSRERRIARTQLAFQRAVEALEGSHARSPRVLVGAALVFSAYALSQPRKWGPWARALAGGKLRLWRPER